MNPERWREISRLYQSAVSRAVHERAAFLAEACHGDDALREEVQSLLMQDGPAEKVLQRLAVEMGAAAEYWNWQDSEREFRRAIELSPNLATVHMWYSDLLAYTGRTTQAVSEARRGQQLNPFNVVANWVLGYQLIFAQQNDAAIELGRKTLELEGGAGVGHWVLGFAYEQQGKLTQAISEFQQGLKLGAPSPTAAADLAHAYAISGKKKEALEVAAELTAKSKQQFVPSWGFAIIETGLGNKDRAFEWLNNGYDERPSDMVSLKADPRMAPLRSDPRYDELLRRMGLSRYQ